MTACEALKDLLAQASLLDPEELRVLARLAARLHPVAVANDPAPPCAPSEPVPPETCPTRRPANPAWARRKGKEFERDVAKRLADVFGGRFVRRHVEARDTSSPGADVVAPRVWIECEARRRTNPRAALRKATRGGRAEGRWPVAVCKDDRKRPHVTMALDDFLALLREWHERRVEAR